MGLHKKKQRASIEDMNDTNKIIVVVTLSVSFLINSLMFGWEATRRSADEIYKINQSVFSPFKGSSLTDNDKIKSCLDGGGMPNYQSGTFVDCKKNK